MRHRPLLLLLLTAFASGNFLEDDFHKRAVSIFEDRNLIPSFDHNASYVATKLETVLVIFSVSSDLWAKVTENLTLNTDPRSEFYFGKHRNYDDDDVRAKYTTTNYTGVNITNHFYLIRKVNVSDTNFTKGDFSYSRQVLKFLRRGALRVREENGTGCLFDGTEIKNWHSESFLERAILTPKTGEYVESEEKLIVTVEKREIVERKHAAVYKVDSLGHFEKNRTQYVTTFAPEKAIVSAANNNGMAVVFQPKCRNITELTKDDNGYASWSPKNFSTASNESVWETVECFRSADHSIFGHIRRISLNKTIVHETDRGFLVASPHEFFNVSYRNGSTEEYSVPDSGIFLTRCPKGANLTFTANPTIFRCRSVNTTVEVFDMRPKRIWVRDDPKPVNSTTVAPSSTNSTSTPSPSFAPTAAALTGSDSSPALTVIFIVLAILAVFSLCGVLVWRWRRNRMVVIAPQGEKGEVKATGIRMSTLQEKSLQDEKDHIEF